jgi:hypothetical protein
LEQREKGTSVKWEILEQQSKDVSLEGLWRSVPLSPSMAARLPQLGFECEDLDESMEIYIVQHPDFPFRSTARFRSGELEGEMDIRMLTIGASVDQNTFPSMAFTLTQEEHFGVDSGSGWAQCIGEDMMVGYLFMHMAGESCFCLERVTPFIPSEIRELIDSGSWREDDHDEEDDDDDDGGIVFLEQFEDAIGSIFRDVAGLTEEDDDEEDATPVGIPVEERSLDAFLAYEDELIDALAAGGIKTVPALLKASEFDLLSIDGIGPSQLADIQHFIRIWKKNG